MRDASIIEEHYGHFESSSRGDTERGDFLRSRRTA